MFPSVWEYIHQETTLLFPNPQGQWFNFFNHTIWIYAFIWRGDDVGKIIQGHVNAQKCSTLSHTSNPLHKIVQKTMVQRERDRERVVVVLSLNLN